MSEYYFSIGHIRDNMCFDNSGVVCSTDYTEKELDTLYNGGTITDKYGDEIYLCEDNQ